MSNSEKWKKIPAPEWMAFNKFLDPDQKMDSSFLKLWSLKEPRSSFKFRDYMGKMTGFRFHFFTNERIPKRTHWIEFRINALLERYDGGMEGIVGRNDAEMEAPLTEAPFTLGELYESWVKMGRPKK